MTPEVSAYLDKIRTPARRRDAEAVLAVMSRVSGEEARLYGSIVGFGHYQWRYASGREGEGPAAAFAARANALVVYLPDGTGAHADLLEKLGPHSTGVACLYLKRVAEVDLDVLEAVVARSYATVTAGTFGHRARESSG